MPFPIRSPAVIWSWLHATVPPCPPSCQLFSESSSSVVSSMCVDEPRLLRQFLLSPGHANTTCLPPLAFRCRPQPVFTPLRFSLVSPRANPLRHTSAVLPNFHPTNACNHAEQRATGAVVGYWRSGQCRGSAVSSGQHAPAYRSEQEGGHSKVSSESKQEVSQAQQSVQHIKQEARRGQLTPALLSWAPGCKPPHSCRGLILPARWPRAPARRRQPPLQHFPQPRLRWRAGRRRLQRCLRQCRPAWEHAQRVDDPLQCQRCKQALRSSTACAEHHAALPPGNYWHSCRALQPPPCPAHLSKQVCPVLALVVVQAVRPVLHPALQILDARQPAHAQRNCRAAG